MKRMSQTPPCKRPTKCTFCSKMSSINSLYTHFRCYHSGERPFECKTCGKGFSSKGILKTHRKIHEAPEYQCCKISSCGKRFHTNTALNLHMESHSTEKKYQCNICKKWLKTAFYLKLHQRSLHEKERKRTFECEICSKFFYTSSCLKTHLKIHDSQRKFWKCGRCCQSYHSRSSLHVHIAKCHDEHETFRGTIHTCVFCNKIYYAKYQMQKHILSHNHENPYFCTICSGEYRTEPSLKYHLETHRINRRPEHDCELCSKSFFTRSQMFNHLRTHIGERPYKCQVCGKNFLTRGGVKSHQTRHIKKEPFQCSICQKKFFHKISLKRCLERHQERVVSLRCATCGKKFSKQSESQIHLRRHIRRKFNFVCGIGDCSFKTYSKLLLDRHKEREHDYSGIHRFAFVICGIKCHASSHVLHHLCSHTLERHYFCKYRNCDKEFRNMANLNRHSRIHDETRERTFPCKLCSKRFFDKDALYSHIGTHTLEKPFKCEICKKDFRTRPKLERHNKIHSGVKPFECLFCAKRFGEIYELRYHIRRHIGEQPYRCQFCKMDFSDYSNRLRHQKTVHRFLFKS